MPRIRAITLYQPWASFIADGLKTIETRRHAGFASLEGQRIAIHAGKRFDKRAFGFFYRDDERIKYRRSNVVFGAVVCTALVKKHRKLTSADSEAACLGYPEGLYGLVLTDVRKLEMPLPAKGSQGIWFFDWPEPEDEEGFEEIFRHTTNQLSLF